jgi:hypothetical protein
MPKLTLKKKQKQLKRSNLNKIIERRSRTEKKIPSKGSRTVRSKASKGICRRRSYVKYLQRKKKPRGKKKLRERWRENKQQLKSPTQGSI